jgi:hypothetical protein
MSPDGFTRARNFPFAERTSWAAAVAERRRRKASVRFVAVPMPPSVDRERHRTKEERVEGNVMSPSGNLDEREKASEFRGATFGNCREASR